MLLVMMQLSDMTEMGGEHDIPMDAPAACDP